MSAMRRYKMAPWHEFSVWLLLMPPELFASGDPIVKPVLGWRDGSRPKRAGGERQVPGSSIPRIATKHAALRYGRGMVRAILVHEPPESPPQDSRPSRRTC